MTQANGGETKLERRIFPRVLFYLFRCPEPNSRMLHTGYETTCVLTMLKPYINEDTFIHRPTDH